MSSTLSGSPEVPDLAVATAHTHVGGVARAGGRPAFPDRRELGRVGHEAYPELKTVVIDTAPHHQPRWF